MAVTLYAALLAFWGIFLSVYVIKGRVKHQAAVGDEHYEVRRRVRTQANFMEYTPFFLLLLFMVEHYGFSLYVVHVLGTLFVVGRLIHAYSLLIHEQYDEKGKFLGGAKYRVYAMPLTFLPIGLSAVILLYRFLTIWT